MSMRQMRECIIPIIIPRRQQFHRNFDLGVSQAEHPEIFEGVPSEGEGSGLVKRSLGLSDKDGTLLADPSADLAERNEICRIFSGKIQKTSPESCSCMYHESILLEQKIKVSG